MIVVSNDRETPGALAMLPTFHGTLSVAIQSEQKIVPRDDKLLKR